MRADAPAMAKSQLRISSSPPAAVTPLTSATDRDPQREQAAERAVQVGDELGERDRIALELDVLLEVAAGAERPSVAGDQHAAHRRVGLDPVDRRRRAGRAPRSRSG